MLTRWKVETSHLVNVPKLFEYHTIQALRDTITALANRRSVRTDKPRFGELTYRYELSQDDEVDVIHVYFTDRHSKRRRFMRLRRV